MPTTLPANNCDPRLITVDDANGCTLTRASIRAMTRQDFEDQASMEVGMDRIIAQTKEGRMAGVRENGLTDLLLSRHVAMPMRKGTGSQSIIAPFRLVPRRNIVNANYFQVEAGEAHANAGDAGYNTPDTRISGNIDLPESAWQITVNIGTSPWVSSPSTGLRDLEKYFLPGNYITVEFKSAVTDVAYTSVFKILDAVNADVGSVRKATVTIQPNKTDTWWGTATTDEKLVYQPTVGTVTLLANSVRDSESWCYQTPGTNNRALLDYWQQTIRYSFSYNEEYIKALESPLTSEFFKKFKNLPIAMQRKQIEMRQEREMYNTFFYGDEINEYQTVETYTSLPQVVDPVGGCLIEFKSNTFGVRTQLAKCGRVYDKQNTPLDLDAIFEFAYNLKRYREGESGTIEVVDTFTDRFTASRIRDIMIKYYKTKFSADFSINMQVGQKIMFNGMAVFDYNIYDLPDQGVRLAVFSHPYFDDKLSAFSTAQKSRGRMLWGIDWSDVAINVLATNSAKRTTNVADEAYRCIIEPFVKQTILASKTIEVAVGDTNRHLIIENFSDACPTLTVQGCDLA